MRYRKLVPAIAVVALASCGPQLDTTRVPVAAASGGAMSSSVTQRLESSLNRYRTSIGKSAIPRHAGLDRMAREHCAFMARNRGKFSLGSENISHFGFESRALVAQQRFGMDSVAENVAGGVIKGDIPARLVSAWTASKSHSYNLRQDWDYTGIGVYVADDGMVYATQVFAIKGHSHMATMDRFRQF